MDRIAGDEAFGLDRASIEEVMDARRFVGRAPEQVDRFLERRVDPVLEANLAPAQDLLKEAEVRV